MFHKMNFSLSWELAGSGSCRGEDFGDQELRHVYAFIRELGAVKSSDSSVKGLRKYSLELGLKAWVLLYQENSTCCSLHCCELFTWCLLPASVYISQEQLTQCFQQQEPASRCCFWLPARCPALPPEEDDARMKSLGSVRIQ